MPTIDEEFKLSTKALICPRCGEPLQKIKKDGDAYLSCKTCGMTIEEERAENSDANISRILDMVGERLSSEKKEAQMEQIARARRRLFNVTNPKANPNPEAQNVIDAASNLLSLLPDDLMGKVYLHSYDSDASNLVTLLDMSTTDDEWKAIEVVRWVILVTEDDKIASALQIFIDRNIHDIKAKANAINALEEERERIRQGIYQSNATRDVFLCYSHKDIVRVNEITASLERNGFLVFTAARNLKHGRGSKQNYIHEIFQAMSFCKVFVFLSSSSSRDARCDSIKVEIPHLTEAFPDKPRIEYLLEPYSGQEAPLVKSVIRAAFPGEYVIDENDLIVKVGKEIQKLNSAALQKSLEEVSQAQKSYASSSIDPLESALLRERQIQIEKMRKRQLAQQSQNRSLPSGESTIVDQLQREQAILAQKRRMQEVQAQAKTDARRMQKQEALAKKDREHLVQSTIDRAKANAFTIIDGCLIKYNGKSDVVDVPSTVREIGKDAFRNLEFIKKVRLPITCTKIRSYAFSGCRNLSTVEGSEYISEIGVGAFMSTALTDFRVTYRLVALGAGAFAGCAYLREIVLDPEIVKFVGARAFDYCKSLTIVLKMKRPLVGSPKIKAWDQNWNSGQNFVARYRYI